MPAAARRAIFAALLGGLVGFPPAAVAQDGGSGHAGHHPAADAGADPAPATPAPEAAAPEGSPGSAMDMGRPAPTAAAGGASGAGCAGPGCMGGGGAKPFFPALMDMPSLTPETRRLILTEAGRRLGIGAEAIVQAQAPLHDAMARGDAAAMQQAAGDLREGVLLIESGASALRAVNEGQPPRQIALRWFKTQTGVPAGDAGVIGEGPWGLTWYHVILMAFLVAFLLGAILIHWARLRRIDGLVQRLAPAGASGAPAARGASGAPAARGASGAPAARGASGAPVALFGAAPAAANTTWSGALRVAAIFRETPQVKTFRLAGPDERAIPFSFLPGQFLTFSAKIDDAPIKRSYTIASSPTQRAYIEITVKREEDGAESRYLHDCTAVGDHLEVSGPAGVFTFTGEETDSIVLISGGVGITPMMCVLRYLTDRGYPGDIFFLHGTRSAREWIFREELEYLEKRHANVHVAITVAESADSAWQGMTGNISKEFIAGRVPDIARRRVHLCGPPAMMAAVRAHLVELGVAEDKIRTEAFGPARGAAAAPIAPGAARKLVPAAVAAGLVEVEFSRSGKTGPLEPGKCVLEAAEAIGVAIDFSCRVGTCGTCVVPLTAGSVTMAEQSGLQAADRARGIVLACQAKSTGNLVVDA